MLNDIQFPGGINKLQAHPVGSAPEKTIQILESRDPAVYLRSEILRDDHGPILQFSNF